MVRLVMAAAGVVAVGHPASAQTVLVQVVGSETSVPLVGAVAHLVSPAGEVLASRLSDRNGRVLFGGVEAGSYRVRAEMIGRATGESDVFGVVAGGSVPLVLRLQSRAIELAGVEVTADAGPCEIRPTEEGRLLADVWEEARKALSAAAVTDRQGIYRYSLVNFEQDLDADGVILDEEQTQRQGYMRSPFGSRAIEELTQEGFVSRSAAEWTYYAPDAEALLSDPFLDTHCFRLVDGGPDQPGLVGLAFEPTGENEHVPDISGTLWLARESVELRWLEYTYENLEPDVRPGDATGRVDFQRMPAGTWAVPKWWIRMPLVLVDVSRSDRRRRITGYRRTGGRVLEVVEAGGRDLARGVSTGAIEGIVVDSLGVPIRGVHVGWMGSPQTLVTNTEGRFNMVGLTEGTYRVRFMDPRLDSLGFEPPMITREVVGGISSYVEFHMPSPGDLLARVCEGETPTGAGVVGGVVRDASTRRPIPEAAVRMRWSRLELNGVRTGLVDRESYTELQTTTDRNGVYRFCAVPRREELTIVAGVAGVDGPGETLRLSDDEAGRMHIVRYAGAAARLGMPGNR